MIDRKHRDKALDNIKTAIADTFYMKRSEATICYYDALFDSTVKKAILEAIRKKLRNEVKEKIGNLRYL